MSNYNPRNERLKKKYFQFLLESNRKAGPTVEGVRKAISRFEAYTGIKDFATFNREQAIAFKKNLAATKAAATGTPLAKSTLLSTVNALKAFFRWLGEASGGGLSIKATDIEYLNLSDKDARAAKEPRFKIFPTLAQIRTVIFSMPTETEVDLRNQALITFTLLTGMRDSAIASLRLKHIDAERKLVMQDPREVKTKRSKRIDTFLCPLGDDLEHIVLDWIRFLREEKGYGGDDPVFPRTMVRQDENRAFAVGGLEPTPWSNTQPIRAIFRAAFSEAGIPYFNPHSFRDTLTQLAERYAPSIEHFKAISQNLGHKHVDTTLTSYGAIGPQRQGELVRSMKFDEDSAVGSKSDSDLLLEIKRLVGRVGD